MEEEGGSGAATSGQKSAKDIDSGERTRTYTHTHVHHVDVEDKRTGRPRDVIICVRIVRLAGMVESFDISRSLIKLERIIAPRREGEPRSNVVVRRPALPNLHTVARSNISLPAPASFRPLSPGRITTSVGRREPASTFYPPPPLYLSHREIVRTSTSSKITILFACTRGCASTR